MQKEMNSEFRNPNPIFLIAILLTITIVPWVQAQSGDIWSEPLNLSRSGAAEAPQIASTPDGRMQVFWWDRFDGLISAYYDGAGWSDPVAAPVLITQEVRGEFVSVPIGVMPTMAADALGWVHAFWMGGVDENTGVPPLMHAQMPLGGTAWSFPTVQAESAVAYDVAADPSGALTLAYVRALHEEPDFPAGVYVKRTAGGGAGWGFPTLVYGSIYFRPLTGETAYLDAAAAGDGSIYLAWEAPHPERALYARSGDGGQSWSEPLEIGDPESGARRPWVALGQEGEVLLLWEATRMAAACTLYQQRSTDGGENWAAYQRVLEDLRSCPQESRFLRTPQGQALLLAGSGGGSLTLAAWNGTVWSEAKGLSFSFDDPAVDQRVYLDALQAALAGDRLAVVGLGQDGEAWYVESQLAAQEWAFAPPPPWSEPVNVSQSAGWPGLPAMAADREGRVHLLWSEAPEEGLPGTALYYARYDGTQWTRPAAVLYSPDGKADQPDLIAAGDRLHAVWSGGENGEILYSYAYTRDAYAAGGWGEPQWLPMTSTVGSSPQIAVDLGGMLHVVYAVPLNEGRGIYHVRSEDGGEAWSAVATMFDAAAAGWAIVDHPSLAIDIQGGLHVAWVRAALPGSGLPQGIYYAHSTDRGESWSEPWTAAEGPYDWPRVAVLPSGQVHLLWNEVDGNLSVWHRWQADGGGAEEGWSFAQRVQGLTNVTGPTGVVPDEAGNLHLLGLGQDSAGEATLLYTTWDGEQWNSLETLRLPLNQNYPAGASLLPQIALGRVSAALRGKLDSQQGGILYLERAIAAVAVTPLPTFTPLPQASPTPAPSPTITPTPQPTVNAAAPVAAPPNLEVGPMSMPLLMLGGVLLAVLLVGGTILVRGLRAGR